MTETEGFSERAQSFEPDAIVDPQTISDSLNALDSFFANIPLAIMFVNEELQIETAARTLPVVFGVARSDWTGCRLESVVPFVADELSTVIRRVLQTGEPVTECELTGALPNDSGSRRCWVISVAPVGNAAARATRVGVMVREVSRQNAPRHLECPPERNREGTLALASALVEAETPEDVVRATVRYATRAFAAAGTVVARCVENSNYVELLDAEGMPPAVADEWRRFPITAPVPLAYVARTGESLFLESAQDWLDHFPALAALASEVGHPANAVVPLLVDQKPIGALGIAFRAARRFDAEERALASTVARQCSLALERARLLAAERVARAAADAANQMKTKFLATMSHEFRTPLNAIAGYTELLELEVHGHLTADQQNDIARIRRSVQHLLGLVDGVLSLLRVESGRLEYRMTDVPLEGVVQFVAEATAPLIAAKGLRFEQLGYRGLTLRADPEKLRQILLNLLSNAIKFTDDGGAITVVCSPPEQPDGRVIRIEVRDTGRGISPADLERVFDPFVRVDQTLNRPTEGTGLGLAISRELARAMNGDLTVASELGVGSTFTLVLPAAF